MQIANNVEEVVEVEIIDKKKKVAKKVAKKTS
jgi:hypothetical protein